jgi:hypothetical protein
MSYQTNIWLANWGEQDLDIFEIEEEFLAYGASESVRPTSETLFDAFCAINDQSGPFPMPNTYQEVIRKLCVEIARLMPKAHFSVRSIGDEFDDVWIGRYSDGKEVVFKTFEGQLA